MIHIFKSMYFYIIYFALCAILRRAYAVYIAAGVVEAKTAASHRGRTGSRREPLSLTQVYNSLATWYGNVGCEVSDQCVGLLFTKICLNNF